MPLSTSFQGDNIFFSRCNEIVQEKEKNQLFSKASFSKNHSSLLPNHCDYRLPYKRDADSILHSKSYSRYVDKTQVVYLVDNDHISHRSLHVQLVSSFARGIGEVLGLNIDLIEAIALGHDVGHPPFGHEGEGYLSALSSEYGNGSFTHSHQSCRLLSEIEPLNLGLAVYDGFLCHDGGMSEHVIHPKFDKSWEDHFKERTLKKNNPESSLVPCTLEGSLVKLCDTLSYIGRDIEDAIHLKIIHRDEVPVTHLGRSNYEILSKLAMDIIQNSLGKEQIAFSEESFESLKILRAFNFQRIYSHPKLKVESTKIKESYRILFEWLLENFKKKQQESYLWTHFIKKRGENYIQHTEPVQMLVDYIAGMTDHFFVRTVEKIFIPSKIKLFD